MPAEQLCRKQLGDLCHLVLVNPEMLSQISCVVTNTDALVQGLKKHWFLRSSFKEKKPKEKK